MKSFRRPVIYFIMVSEIAREIVFALISADVIVPLDKYGAKRLMKRLQSKIKNLKHLPD